VESVKAVPIHLSYMDSDKSTDFVLLKVTLCFISKKQDRFCNYV
jgi:hypothetical protein